MTKSEFLSKLAYELKKNNISDAHDIISEYEQHFAFKTADGFSEEEIAAKLGDPAVLAAQFESANQDKEPGQESCNNNRARHYRLLRERFCVADSLGDNYGGFFNLHRGDRDMLVQRQQPLTLIPNMPYWPGVVFGLSLAALSVLSAAGCVYFAAFIANSCALTAASIKIP